MSFITKKRKKVDLEDEDIIENVGPFWKNILESGKFLCTMKRMDLTTCLLRQFANR